MPSTSSSQNALHFASQAAADSYLVSKQIETMETARATRSMALRRESLRSSLQQRVVALKAPIYTLSDDILSMIFILFVEENGLRAAIVLAQVVSRWRRVSLAMPRLWASFSVNFPPRLAAKKFGNRIKELSRRAATIPLKIIVQGTLDIRNHGPNSNAWKVLMSLRPRCVTLSITGQPVAWTSALISSPFFDLVQCPNLRSLSIKGCRVDVESCRALLSNLKALSFLEELSITSTDFFLPHNSQAVELVSLRHVTCDVPSVMILPQLVVPALNTICLDGTNRFSPLDQLLRIHAKQPRRWPASNLASVRIVHIQSARIHRQTLLALIRLMPGLEEIRLEQATLGFDPESYNSDDPGDLISAINIQYQSNPISLTKLTIDHCDDVPCFLRDLLETYAGTERTLQLDTIVIKHGSRMSAKMTTWVESHAKAVEWAYDTREEEFGKGCPELPDPDWLI